MYYLQSLVVYIIYIKKITIQDYTLWQSGVTSMTKKKTRFIHTNAKPYTPHGTTTTWTKLFREYNINGEYNKIKRDLKITYKYENLGFNIITKEGLEWRHNKSEHVFINTTRTPWYSSPKPQRDANVCITLCYLCLRNPRP